MMQKEFSRTFRTAVLSGVFFLGSLAAAAAAERLPFAAYEPPPAPDYARAESWAARPDLRDGADVVRPGDPYGDRQGMASVDVFYIHPTTYGGDTWNQDVADAETNRWTDKSVMEHQAGAFNACCRVYAPRYRQAATGAVFARDDSGERAYALAYEDVRRAFDHYIRHYNNGRPFMLAGHSQGSRHLVKLLEDIRADKALMARFVAGYAIGYGISVGESARSLAPLRMCGTPEDTGCLVTWSSFDVTGNAASYIARSEKRYVTRHGTEDGKTLSCTNPLTFDAAHPVGAGGANPQVKSAACRDGILYVELGQARNIIPLPGGNLHMNDISLFYDNLRADALGRAKAFGMKP